MIDYELQLHKLLLGVAQGDVLDPFVFEDDESVELLINEYLLEWDASPRTLKPYAVVTELGYTVLQVWDLDHPELLWMGVEDDAR